MGWFWGFSTLCESSTEGFFRFRGLREEDRARVPAREDLERAREELERSREDERDRDLDRDRRESLVEESWWKVVETVVSVTEVGVRGRS